MSAHRAWLLSGIVALCAFNGLAAKSTPVVKHKPAIKLLSLTTQDQPTDEQPTPPPSESVTTTLPAEPTAPSAWKHLPVHVVIPSADDNDKAAKDEAQTKQQTASARQYSTPQPRQSSQPQHFAQPSPEEMENIFSSLRDVFNMADMDDDDDDDDNDSFMAFFN